ncbi:glucose 1-dehydrogenase [Flagellimonas algicola]|uniref:Glucose 1-dehydrogenase n=2 Tax=Flagellimonas algicola TaxID=2583815 RepID=A0ABY2WIY5_9FLAO|nr:glucose 1-dehydrogenase [Allomuricauda algicola]
MNMDFKNKVVLITGTSSGIGKGAALEFAQKGAKVVLASRNKERNLELLREIESLGTEAIFIPTDMSKSKDIQDMVTETMKTFGRLDIAVNNAGVEGTPGVKAMDYEEDVWDQVLDVNLKSVWLCMKHQLRAMLSNGGGNIINISSLAGLKGGGAGVAYHASKFGVVGITQAVALEYAEDNIRVNAICPAVIETPMAQRAFDEPEKRKAAIAMHPVGRFGKVQEVVSAILWLASPSSGFVTGTSIPVDGGASL